MPDTSQTTIDWSKKPFNGFKTHPLTEHAKEVLRDLARFGPRPTQEINAGVRDRFRREALTQEVMLPSPYKTHKGRAIPFEQITAAGKSAIDAS